RPPPARDSADRRGARRRRRGDRPARGRAGHAGSRRAGNGRRGSKLGLRRRPEEVNATSGTGALLGIGAASARAGVTERALRYYQQLGLLTPAQCTSGGMRRYSKEDLARVERIRQL